MKILALSLSLLTATAIVAQEVSPVNVSVQDLVQGQRVVVFYEAVRDEKNFNKEQWGKMVQLVAALIKIGNTAKPEQLADVYDQAYHVIEQLRVLGTPENGIYGGLGAAISNAPAAVQQESDQHPKPALLPANT